MSHCHENSAQRRAILPDDLVPLPELPGALCADHETLPPQTWDLAVDGEDAAGRRERRDAAVDVCSQCPIRHACLRQAQNECSPSGVWGGEVFSPKDKTAPPRGDVGGAAAAHHDEVAKGPRQCHWTALQEHNAVLV